VAIGAAVYGYVALRRSSPAAVAPRRLSVVPGSEQSETDDMRKAA
jgi:hypothetical protein